jgi:hypothetical protein
LGWERGWIRQERDSSVEVGDGVDVPGIFGNDVDGEDIDFGAVVGDDAGAGAAPRVHERRASSPVKSL